MVKLFPKVPGVQLASEPVQWTVRRAGPDSSVAAQIRGRLSLATRAAFRVEGGAGTLVGVEGQRRCDASTGHSGRGGARRPQWAPRGSCGPFTGVKQCSSSPEREAADRTLRPWRA